MDILLNHIWYTNSIEKNLKDRDFMVNGNSNWELIVEMLLVFVLTPYLTARVVSWAGHISKKMLVEDLGPNSQLAVGGLGVAIHELGHAAFAFLFHHKVTHVQLLNFHYAATGNLGSVEHSWNQKSIYQRLGNFFIGLAPFYTCSMAIFLLQKFLLGNSLEFTKYINQNSSLNLSEFGNVFNQITNSFITGLTNASWIFIIIYLILAVMIASTGYDLSREDFQTVNQGILSWIVVVIVVAVLTLLFNFQVPMKVFMNGFFVLSIIFLMQAILYVVISILLIGILSFL